MPKAHRFGVLRTSFNAQSANYKKTAAIYGSQDGYMMRLSRVETKYSNQKSSGCITGYTGYAKHEG